MDLPVGSGRRIHRTGFEDTVIFELGLYGQRDLSCHVGHLERIADRPQVLDCTADG
jgi:hypothetical protein